MNNYSESIESEVDEPDNNENPYSPDGDIKINIVPSSFRKTTLNLKKAADLNVAKIHGVKYI